MEGFIMSSRREFIKQILAGGAGVVALSAFPSEVFAGKELVKIVILHTNDVHSHIDPFPLNDPKYGGLGGAARRAALIKRIRSEEPNVLLLDAGDIFQGTPYFNMYGGSVEFELMSKMGYDATTIGNHDFDNGLDGLVKMLPHSNFPFIVSNYDFSDTPMNGKTIPYKVFNKDGIKVGVFGLGIDPEGLIDKKLYGNTVYLDPLEEAAKMSYLLKNDMQCDLVICLSHLGYKYKNNKVSDEVLAKKSKNIDLIIGAHTHTFLETPISYTNSDGKEVLVSQVGWAGIRLGKIEYFFERKNGKRQKRFLQGTSMLISEKTANT
jgi:5'-nucleotidase